MCETLMMHLFNSYCELSSFYCMQPRTCVCLEKSEFVISQLAYYFLETVWYK